jgi:hypothetical protein
VGEGIIEGVGEQLISAKEVAALVIWVTGMAFDPESDDGVRLHGL